MAIGQFGKALGEVLERSGDTRGKVSRVVHVDPSLIGKIVKGSRRPSTELMRETVRHYDDGQLILAAVAEVSSGASVPWLDRADLHPSSTYIKTLEEIREAEEALMRLPVTKSLAHLTERDRHSIKAGLLEQIEAITALTHNVVLICRKYEISYSALWDEHRAEMKSKKYMS